MNQQNQKIRVLIVEDDQFLAGILMDHLSWGETWDLDLATTGEEGLKKMRAAKPDILLLDIILPGIDGYEVLRQVKADRELAGIPVFILSNLGQKEEIAKGINLGAEDFLIKAHLDINDIRNKIKKALEKMPAS